MQLVMQKVMHKAPPLSTIRSDIPPSVDRVIMRALEIDPANRPNSVSEWIGELETAAEDVDEHRRPGTSRLVVLAPVNAEVYIDDERRGSVGSSGRVVLNDIPAGRHVLRVSKLGEKDDERVIEIREEANEQVIQAHLRSLHGASSHPTSSQGGSTVGSAGSSLMPGIVACVTCGSRFAQGVRFCGRCGGGNFMLVSPGEVSTTFPCPRCSNQLPNNSRFCGRCGLNITPAQSSHQPANFTSAYRQPVTQAERLCRRCGGAYPPHIRFCGRCGLTLQ
jgi:DNA-directed RNA polymerase subunit M/transcription elongation factor TFIIS